MARIWYDADTNLEPVRNEVVAVIGYGIQGQAQASNLRDSGLKVVVGLRRDGGSWERAEKEGHEVLDVAEAAKRGDIIHILVPDMVQARLYREAIEANLKLGKALGFSHGAAIHWGWIKPPSWVDVIMLAPKAPGQRLRELYLQNFGTPALVAVQQDYTKKAWPRILAIAKGVGCTRAGVIETTFKEEVETDWFGEQVDLCGGVDRLIRTAFDVLVENGYQPEVAYFECLHELKLIVDLIQRYGISGMYRRVSETARYGGLTRGSLAIGDATRKAMQKILEDVRSGRYAREWVQAYEKEGVNAFEKHLRELESHSIEKVGQRLRKMMWPSGAST